MVRLVTLMVAASLLCAGGQVRGSEERGEILDGIQKRYGSLPGLQVEYTREVITRSMSLLGTGMKGDLARGILSFRPPGSLRLDQETPSVETLIATRDVVWWYEPSKKRAHRYPAREFGKELSLLSDVFRGLSGGDHGFRIDTAPADDSGHHRIYLRPDPPWAEVDRIVLTITGDHEITVVDIHNQLGSITRFTLGTLTVKETFEDGFFCFEPPEGVEVADQVK